MSKYADFEKNPLNLDALFSVADSEDLDILTDYITDNGKGRLALDSGVCKRLVASRAKHHYSNADRRLIKKEFLLFGGNSLANLSRSLLRGISLIPGFGTALPEVNATVEYRTVVCEVANQVGASYDSSGSVLDVEKALLIHIFNQGVEKLSPDERDRVMSELGVKNMTSAGGATIGGATVIGAAAWASMAGTGGMYVASTVASAVSSQLIGRAVTGGALAVAGRPLAMLAGPVGLAVGALWTIAGLSSPAYRVTLPCVVQIAFMRVKYLTAAKPAALIGSN